MKVTMIGTGYVGLVTGTCFADLGHTVICLDVDEAKITRLNQGEVPIYEPGLADLIKRNVREGRLSFTTNAEDAIAFAEVIFIAVGTPSAKDGSVNLSFIESAATAIGKYMDGYKVIVDKSTVPVGTADWVKGVIRQHQRQPYPFDLVSNPEFLREGEAIKDFMNPDRIVIGAEGAKAQEIMTKIYQGIERTGKPIMITDIRSAEMIKYASNAMLATPISFMNELSRVCEKVGADIKVVARGMGLDSRIGARFLQAGVGYGGSCFPKDVQGLIATARTHGIELQILSMVELVNVEQKLLAVHKVTKLLGEDLQGKTIAIWGLAFKPKTDDMREAPSLIVIPELQKRGARIVAFDPEAEENAKKLLRDVEYVAKPLDAVRGADAVLVLTEWDEFRNIDLEQMKQLLRQPNIIDGRNIYDPKEMRSKGFIYASVGRT